MDYCIIHGEPDTVQEQVRDRLAKGWVLNYFGYSNGKCIQVMTKKEVIRRKPKQKPVGTHPLTLWVNKNCPRVQSMAEPITDDNALEIEKKSDAGLWDRDTVKHVLLKMDNWADLTKKRVSAYKTLITWMRKEVK